MKLKCTLCEQAGKLQCQSCKISTYCSQHCQLADFARHIPTCHAVKSFLEKIALEKTAVQKAWPNIFEVKAGRFWAYVETRDYVRTKHQYLLYLCNIGTEPALREAITQGKEILHLCRADSLAVRYVVASALLRIDTDSAMQECYGLVKSWGPNRQLRKNKAVWKMNPKPYQLDNNSDLCESVSSQLSDNALAFFPVAITVIKMRLFLRLRQFFDSLGLLFIATIQPDSFVRHFRFRAGIMSSIVSFLVPEGAWPRRKAKHGLRVRLHTHLMDLSAQVQQLLQIVHAHNSRIWKILVHPAPARCALIPDTMSPGSAEEALCVTTLFLPLFQGASRCAHDMRRILVDLVGEAPEYDLTPAHPNGEDLYKVRVSL